MTSSSFRPDRRSFVTGAATLGASTLAAPAVASDRLEWRMVTAWPKGAPGVGTAAQNFADRVNLMAEGRLKISVYGAGEIVPPFEVFDAVASGAAQVGHGASHFWAGKDPAFNYFTGLPFGLMANERIGWLMFGGGQPLWDECYAPFGVRGFFAGSSGVQAGGWFKEPLTGLDSLQGLKMRIAGLGGEILRRLGVSVTLLPPGDIFNALQSGAIDAAEWVGPWNDLAFGLSDIAKHYYLPAFHEPGPALEVLVNAEAFDSLPSDLKAIVESAAHGAALQSLGEFAFYNAQAFSDLENRDVQVHAWPEEIIAAAKPVARDVIADLATSSPLAHRIHDSYSSYLEKAVPYALATEAEMLRIRQPD